MRDAAVGSKLVMSLPKGGHPLPIVEESIAALGLVLPSPLILPPGVTRPFPWVRVVGSRAIISGHLPTNPDGSLASPLGKVGAEVTEQEAYVAARLVGLAILGSLKRELGSLERIASWSRVLGMVNSAPDFVRQPAVINGFTDLIVGVFGQERGAHARSAVGMAELPFRVPVEIEAEVELARP
jgi:enamine deaminase RidA (YjgF/YER057c/UK114 family)